MSANFLQTFADGNAESRRQMGCMTGIFHMFDRQYLLSGRRLTGPNHRRLPHLGDSGGAGECQVSSSPRIVFDKNLSRSCKENPRVSLDFSRTSFSSSSSSSLSSLPSTAQREIPSGGGDRKTASGLVPDIRDVVMDSIHRGDDRHLRSDAERKVAAAKVHSFDDSLTAFLKLKGASKTSSAAAGPQTPAHQLPADAPRRSLDARRLSLDSKEGSPWHFDMDAGDMDGSGGDSLQEAAGSNRQPSTIIAKLMGLETLPNSTSGAVSSGTTKVMQKQPANPAGKNQNSGMRSTSKSKLPIETAPWKQPARKAPPELQEAPVMRQTVSGFGDMEKLVKELTIEQASKDVVALKRILDSMKAKGLLELERAQSCGLPEDPERALAKENNSAGSFKAPIVVMKPANSVDLSDESEASIVPLSALPFLPRLKSVDKQKEVSRSFSEKPSPRVPVDRKLNCRTEGSKQKPTETSSKPSRENHRKDQMSTSLRTKQRKLDADRKSRPPANSSNMQQQSANRNSVESTSPRNRLRRKPAPGHQNDRPLSNDVNKTSSWSQSHQNADTSSSSDGKMSISSQADVDVTRTDRLAELSMPALGNSLGCQAVSSRTPSKKKSTSHLWEEVLVNAEQPSPVSILDAGFDDENSPSSRKKTPATKGGERRASEDPWNPTCVQHDKVSSKFNHKKFENIQSLVQKLRQFSLTDADGPVVDHIALLCDTPSQDHRYISEILLASGLLMNNQLPIQLHSSGYPINPDLFLIVEQRKSSRQPQLKVLHGNKGKRISDPAKLHRKLLFDLVNELLIQKLNLPKTIPRTVPTGQRLLKDLCAEVEQIRTSTSCSGSEESSCPVPGRDILRKLEGWDDFGREFPGMVLDIERLIFRDLVGEVLTGDTPTLRQGKEAPEPMLRIPLPGQ